MIVNDNQTINNNEWKLLTIDGDREMIGQSIVTENGGPKSSV